MRLKLDDHSLLGQEQRKTRGKPGPGTYHPDFSKTVASNGTYSLRGKPVEKEDNRAPGPGAYKAGTASDIKQAPSFRFGSGPMREPQPKPSAPGPGNYRIPCEIGNMPQYTSARPKEFGYI